MDFKYAGAVKRIGDLALRIMIVGERILPFRHAGDKNFWLDMIRRLLVAGHEVEALSVDIEATPGNGLPIRHVPQIPVYFRPDARFNAEHSQFGGVTPAPPRARLPIRTDPPHPLGDRRLSVHAADRRRAGRGPGEPRPGRREVRGPVDRLHPADERDGPAGVDSNRDSHARAPSRRVHLLFQTRTLQTAVPEFRAAGYPRNEPPRGISIGVRCCGPVPLPNSGFSVDRRTAPRLARAPRDGNPDPDHGYPRDRRSRRRRRERLCGPFAGRGPRTPPGNRSGLGVAATTSGRSPTDCGGAVLRGPSDGRVRRHVVQAGRSVAMSMREFDRLLGRRDAARVARGETFIEVKEGLRTRLRGEVLSDVNPTGLAYGAPQVLVVGKGRDQTRHLQGIPG